MWLLLERQPETAVSPDVRTFKDTDTYNCYLLTQFEARVVLQHEISLT